MSRAEIDACGQGSCDTRGSDTQGSGFDKLQINRKSIHNIVEKEKKRRTGGEANVIKKLFLNTMK